MRPSPKRPPRGRVVPSLFIVGLIVSAGLLQLELDRQSPEVSSPEATVRVESVRTLGSGSDEDETNLIPVTPEEVLSVPVCVGAPVVVDHEVDGEDHSITGISFDLLRNRVPFEIAFPTLIPDWVACHYVEHVEYVESSPSVGGIVIWFYGPDGFEQGRAMELAVFPPPASGPPAVSPLEPPEVWEFAPIFGRPGWFEFQFEYPDDEHVPLWSDIGFYRESGAWVTLGGSFTRADAISIADSMTSASL